MLPQSLYTAQQVKLGEVEAAKQAGVSLYQLMLRAGEATYQWLRDSYPNAESVTIVCGSGNNGGDGFVVAKLAKQAGLSVRLLLSCDVSKLVGDAKQAQQEWSESGGEVESIALLDEALHCADVVVDALLGTGLVGNLRDDMLNLINAINQSGKAILSIDTPSGLCANTGAILGDSIIANATVTFIGIKQGLVTGKAREVVGKLHFSDLGVGKEFETLYPSNVTALTLDDVSHTLPSRSATAHKGTNGRLLCVGGFEGYAGAIRLCSEAAVRSGAGLVSTWCHPNSVLPLQVACPEVMTKTWLGDCSELDSKLQTQDAVALGPGLGLDMWAKNAFDAVQRSCLPKVLDADGLTLLAQYPNHDSLRVITPHPGEAARLLNCSVKEVEADRYQAARELQHRCGGVVVLKGAGTLIYDGEHMSVCLAGNPGMASGGMGDVLTGIIAALLAQRKPLSDAARLGVLLHSRAADELSEKYGQIGLLAHDLIPEVRRLLNQKCVST